MLRRRMEGGAMADLLQVESLIAAHINAVADQNRLFELGDWGLASKEDIRAAAEPVDAALIDLCAARPSDAAADARRAEYLNVKVPEAVYGDTDLANAVIAALVGGAT